MGDYTVTVLQEAAAQGRNAFRELHEAYNSLDLIVYPINDNFSRCQGEGAGTAHSIDITLSLDEFDGVHVTVIISNMYVLEDMISYSLPSQPGAECAYWDQSDNSWKSDGLTLEVKDGIDVCTSNHLTLFTIIHVS